MNERSWKWVLELEGRGAWEGKKTKKKKNMRKNMRKKKGGGKYEIDYIMLRTPLALCLSLSPSPSPTLAFDFDFDLLYTLLFILVLVLVLLLNPIARLRLHLLLHRRLRRGREPRNLPPDEIIQHHLRHGIHIRFPAAEQPPRLASQEFQKRRGGFVITTTTIPSHIVRAFDMSRLGAPQHGVDVLGWVLHVLDAHDAAEEDVFFRVGGAGGHDARAVNEVNSFHEGDVLPYFRFAGNRGDGADFFLAESVDDGGFARVGVADEADGDLLAVGVESGELAEELD